MNEVYVIKTDEEYSAVLARLNILLRSWHRSLLPVVQDSRKSYPNITEIIKLEKACSVWELENNIGYGFFED